MYYVLKRNSNLVPVQVISKRKTMPEAETAVLATQDMASSAGFQHVYVKQQFEMNDAELAALDRFRNEIEGNAIHVLGELMQERMWHKGIIPGNKASGYKDLLKKGRLSYEMASFILNQLGWSKMKNEVWWDVKSQKL
jgi:hypothetical protein